MFSSALEIGPFFRAPPFCHIKKHKSATRSPWSPFIYMKSVYEGLTLTAKAKMHFLQNHGGRSADLSYWGQVAELVIAWRWKASMWKDGGQILAQKKQIDSDPIRCVNMNSRAEVDTNPWDFREPLLRPQRVITVVQSYPTLLKSSKTPRIVLYLLCRRYGVYNANCTTFSTPVL